MTVAIQIPGRILRFLDTASAALAGTRDKSLVPRVHRVSSWMVEPDGQTMGCSIAEVYMGRLIDNLDDNGRFVVTILQPVSHETYQFKGEYIDSRTVSANDLKVSEQIRGRFVEEMKIKNPTAPEAVTEAYNVKPSVVVRFRVEEIFVQTPGPGAGTRLVPPEEK
jgi:hypothetical protein